MNSNKINIGGDISVGMSITKDMIVRAENTRLMGNMFLFFIFSKEMKKMYTNVMIEN